MKVDKKEQAPANPGIWSHVKNLSGITDISAGVKDINDGNYGSGLYKLTSGSLRLVVIAALTACVVQNQMLHAQNNNLQHQNKILLGQNSDLLNQNKLFIENTRFLESQHRFMTNRYDNLKIQNQFLTEKLVEFSGEHLTKMSTGSNENVDRPDNPLKNRAREIRIASVFDNRGQERLDLSDLTTENHKAYAERYGLPHDVQSTSLVANECLNPLTNKNEDCSSYWNKIKYYVNWCQLPKKSNMEEWAIYADDDAVYSNPNINPSDAIDQLREGRDTSFIVAIEGSFSHYSENEGGKERGVKGAVNSGVMIVRKDEKGCDVINRVWNKRNAPTAEDKYSKDCPTYGICSDQRHGNEQGAIDRVLWDEIPNEIGMSVSRIAPRDTTSSTRAHIALNTANRDGCFQVLNKDGNIGGPFTILHHDLRYNTAGIWRPGDWIGQTSGFPLTGRDLSFQDQNFCAWDDQVPVTGLRLKKVREMIESTYSLKKADRKVGDKFPPINGITIGTAYNNNGDEKRDKVSSLVNADHFQYAKKWGLTHELTSTNLLQNDCTHPTNGLQEDCAGYWNKIQRIRNWLEMNPGNGEKVFIVLDDDMVFLNNNIDPYDAIKQLGPNADVIIMKDVINWLSLRFENKKTLDPRASVNTGLMIIRNTKDAKDFVEKVWSHRNDPTNQNDCPTLGLCKNQNAFHEQEATAKVLLDNPYLLNKGIVATLDPREKSSTGVNRIAANTFKREGCFVRKQEYWDESVFDYGINNNKDEQYGACKSGDWLCQTAGVPVWGKKIGDKPVCDYPTSGEIHNTLEKEIRLEYITALLKGMKKR